MTEPIRVEGLVQLTRGLKQLDADLPKAVRVALNAAPQLVIEDARPHIPQRTGRAARSLRAASTRTESRIRAGGKRAPYYPWLDFGGRVGRNKSVERPFRKEGRFIWKSYADLTRAGKLQRTMSDALVNIARRAGLEVTSGG